MRTGNYDTSNLNNILYFNNFTCTYTFFYLYFIFQQYDNLYANEQYY